MTRRTTQKPKNRNNTKKRPRRKPGPKPSKLGLKKKLDRAFSWYIRLTHADEDGNCTCWTCGKVLPWYKIQNGHFVSRRHFATRWRPDNCRPQCYACNIANSGEQWKFGKALDAYYGEGHADRLFRLANKPYKPTIEQYEDYIEYYEGHVATILARRIKRDRREREAIPSKIRQALRIYK